MVRYGKLLLEKMMSKVYVAVNINTGEPILWSTRDTVEDVRTAMTENDTIKYSVMETSLGTFKTTVPLTEPLKKADYTALTKLVHEYIKKVRDGESSVKNFDNWIYEAAVEAVYGKDIWEEINSLS